MNNTIIPNSQETIPPYTISPENNTLDIRRYIGLFLSNWYWFALALFSAGLLAWAINTYSERFYTVTSSLLIKDDQSGTDLTGLEKLLPGGDIFKSQQNLKNEIGILKSFNLNFKVMEQLPAFHVSIVGIGRRRIFENRYYKSAPFIVIYDSLGSQRTNLDVTIKITSENTYSVDIGGKQIKEKVLFGERFKEAGFNFSIVKSDSTKFRFKADDSNRFIISFIRPESLANLYRGKLNIEPISEEATLVTLSVTGVVPQQESEYLNKLMEVYINEGLEFKKATALKTIEFIDEQLLIIQDSLEKAEKRLQDFRLSNKLIDLSAEGLDVKNRLETVTEEKVTTQLQKQYYEYLAEYISTNNESGDIISPSIWGVTDQMLIKNIDELGRLQIQRKQLKYNLAEDQPAIKFVEAQIQDAKRALAENVRNSILTVTRTLNDMDSRIDKIENELKRFPITERKLINIERRFDLNNTVYTYMLEKRSEASIAKASRVANNRTIDYARSFNSVRIKPQTQRNYMIAILLGIIIPGIYIFLVDRLHNKILDKKDIERGTDAPILGFVGHNYDKNEIPLFKKPSSSLSESFRTIRTNLKYYLKGEKKAIISVTSTLSGEGKTFVSTNLSAALSTLGKKTLLIGLDLRKPRMHKILGTSGNVGLSSYLIGEAKFEDIIIKTEFDNLYFTPSGPVPPNPSELIESEKMKEFIGRAREEFDFVVLDTPPVAIVSDGLILGQYADLNIFVVRQRFSFVNTLELIQAHFIRKDLKSISLIVNDINIKGYYGYGLRYGYGFYEGYGYSYGNGNYSAYGYGKNSGYYMEE